MTWFGRAVLGLGSVLALGYTARHVANGEESNPVTAWHRAISRTTGLLLSMRIENPTIRELIYRGFALVNEANLNEVQYPIGDYPCFDDFFTRRLQTGARPELDHNMRLAVAEAQQGPAKSPRLVSPVDGRMLIHGTIGKDGLLEQIKGQTFTLKEFLGKPLYKEFKSLKMDADKSLYYCVIYLSPRDYHRIHSPANWAIIYRVHVPGLLHSVSPFVVQRVPRVFSRNERVVLSGLWDFGFFSLTAVGAMNVGSISVAFEPHLRTNLAEAAFMRPLAIDPYLPCPLGQELAAFHMGSTVVLVFHGPKGFQFHHQAHERVQLGEPLGAVSSDT